MALIKCTECGNEISSVAAACPQCRYPLKSASVKARELDPVVGMRPVFKVLLGLIVVLACVGIVASYFAPAPRVSTSQLQDAKDEATNATAVLTADAQAVKSTREQMAEIETAVSAGQDEIVTLSQGYREKSGADRADDLAKVNEELRSMNEIHERSTNIKARLISNSDAARFVAAMIDDHKQWALIQQASTRALEQENIKAFRTLGPQADQLAGQEALHIMMAYKAVNLDME